MKVKFLRNYGKYKIGAEEVITVDEKEKEYLISTKTILILENEEEKNNSAEDIPVIGTPEVPKENKNEKRKNTK
ncbi:hypothetical protein M2102_000532 [Fusobacterium sp. PH5-7]|uniref:hypothetical protein n=1 Tax=Fusobacterium sp. PH5-7 TaxID=2940528 RepID=UPI002474EAEE|nr:hypothetical protein [Fusobacterium sp. PH5-7]MDH6456917.1 hypothetical protein [Fusobacterium sp. PH5-7]